MDGRSLATIGRPDAMYSNSFNGDVNRVEMVDAGFGSTTTSAACRRRRASRGKSRPVNVMRSAQ